MMKLDFRLMYLELVSSNAFIRSVWTWYLFWLVEKETKRVSEKKGLYGSAMDRADQMDTYDSQGIVDVVVSAASGVVGSDLMVRKGLQGEGRGPHLIM
jgi:hypothetical protein